MKKILKSVFAIAIAALTFTSCDDVPSPYPEPTANTSGTTYDGAEGDGSLATPYNVAGVLQYVSSLEAGVESENDVYIKGTVASITEEYTTNYGNGTFVITDANNAQLTFTVYRALYLGNKKFASGDTQVKIGDEVVVCGKVVNFKGNTPETVSGKAYLYSLNGTGGSGTDAPAGEAKGDGTLANPYNAAGVIAYINSLGADTESPADVYIAGKVVSISEQFGTQYGNATFDIAEEGAEGTTFTVYRALYLGNKKYTSGDLLKEGDNVIVCGKVVNFKGNTPETVSGKAYLYALNGKSEGGSEVTPTPSGNGEGTEANPYDVPAAIAKASATGAYVKGYIVGCVEDKSISSATFSAGSSQTNILIAASANETSTANCMAVQLPTGDIRTKLNLKDNPGNLKKAVVLYGNIENYFGQVGLKTVTYAVLDGTEIGKKPGETTPDTPATGGKGTGTLDDPFNAAAATAAASALASGKTSDQDYYIKGKISEIKYAFDAAHGTATFFISDDGTTAGQFQVYSTYYLGNRAWVDGDKQVALGDEVIIYGKLTNYNGTPETASKKSYIYSLNGATSAKRYVKRR